MTRLIPILLVLGFALLVSVTAPHRIAAQAPAAQPANPTFEVASIRRNTSGDGMIGFRLGTGQGQVNLMNVPLRQLLVLAFGVQPYQIIGGPEWQTTERYDIVAKAESGNNAPGQLNLMLQSLLADRFKLISHRETRELPVYYLTKARQDGKLGEGLKPASTDCGALGRGRPGGPPPPPTDGPRAGGPPAGAPPAGLGAGCRMMTTPGRLIAAGQPLSLLTQSLANQVGRPVIDKTGITGNFDFELSFMPEGRGAPVGPLPPGVPDLPPIDPNAPSLFTALQEQLGLKLESGRGPVEVVVIDSAQRPVED
jgi:uncharacterized protein (TIGR03435 family)